MIHAYPPGKDLNFMRSKWYFVMAKRLRIKGSQFELESDFRFDISKLNLQNSENHWSSPITPKEKVVAKILEQLDCIELKRFSFHQEAFPSTARRFLFMSASKKTPPRRRTKSRVTPLGLKNTTHKATGSFDVYRYYISMYTHTHLTCHSRFCEVQITLSR